eukprot:4866694-Prymnesium_polylepis.1
MRVGGGVVLALLLIAGCCYCCLEEEEEHHRPRCAAARAFCSRARPVALCESADWSAAAQAA